MWTHIHLFLVNFSFSQEIYLCYHYLSVYLYVAYSTMYQWLLSVTASWVPEGGTNFALSSGMPLGMSRPSSVSLMERIVRIFSYSIVLFQAHSFPSGVCLLHSKERVSQVPTGLLRAKSNSQLWISISEYSSRPLNPAVLPPLFLTLLLLTFYSLHNFIQSNRVKCHPHASSSKFKPWLVSHL